MLYNLSELHQGYPYKRKSFKNLILILTMYFFATGSCITELESNSHDIEKERKTEPVAPGKPKRYVLNKEATTMFDNDAKMAADSMSVEERF